VSNDEGKELGINLQGDGIPSILPGVYRDGLRRRDLNMIQEVLTVLELRLLTPEFKIPDLDPIVKTNGSNLTIAEAQRL